MKYDPDKHHRRSIRLKGTDYSQVGAYFVTVCTQNYECLFGSIVDDKMRLNDAGRMIQMIWDEIPQRFPNALLDASIVMPNHFHGILILTDNGRGEYKIRPYIRPDGDAADPQNEGDHKNKGDHKDRPYGTLPGTLGRIVQAFKSITTHQYIRGVKQNGWPPFPGKLWQRNYYEHIIRDESSLNRIRQYIMDNPMKWECDRENPANTRRGESCIRPESPAKNKLRSIS
ncbi:MAG: hypothetical protein J7M27_13010 [Candidatus Latescibacteria bacterium]|nr:hypothetical protein [Candidatus Latescibacterota bacterium]